MQHSEYEEEKIPDVRLLASVNRYIHGLSLPAVHQDRQNRFAGQADEAKTGQQRKQTGLHMESLLKRIVTSALFIAASTSFALHTSMAQAQDWEHRDCLRAELTSFNQVPSVLARGHGHFYAEINEDHTISFELSYAEMSSPVVQAHIHFGAGKTNGGVMVFLCGGVKPACPASGTVTGTITAADVSVLPATNGDSVIPQGVQPGDLAGLIKAVRSGDTYVNVHTTNFPNGEIRGQVHVH